MTQAIVKAKVKNVVGLNRWHRIDFSDIENLSCIALAHFSPFYAKVIGELAGGLTQQQVYTRCKKSGYSLRDIRNGKSPFTNIIVKKFSVKYIKPVPPRKALPEVIEVEKIVSDI